MRKKDLERILEQIARKNHTTAQNVRKEMEKAMEFGQSNTDPAVQAIWASIPRKGCTLTLEEFLEYLIGQASNPFS